MSEEAETHGEEVPEGQLLEGLTELLQTCVQRHQVYHSYEGL